MPPQDLFDFRLSTLVRDIAPVPELAALLIDPALAQTLEVQEFRQLGVFLSLCAPNVRQKLVVDLLVFVL